MNWPTPPPMLIVDSLEGPSNPVGLSLRETLADPTPVTVERLSRQLAPRRLEPDGTTPTSNGSSPPW